MALAPARGVCYNVRGSRREGRSGRSRLDMPDDPSCQAPQAPTGAVPRTCVPFAHVPAVPVVAVPYVPVPVPSGLPVLSVAGILPDRTGNVDVTQFLEGWAAEPLAGKADKAVPSAAGNLASLDASGNLADSGATPASIKAAAVAEVVANAPGTMDTLKEIADILGSAQQSGSVLKRIADLESAGGISMDATLTRPGVAADAKAVGDALRSGFTEWEFSGSGYDSSTTHIVTIDEYDLGGETVYIASLDGEETVEVDSLDVTSVTFIVSNITATRHLVTPTKTSQLTNDGDGTNAFVKTNDPRLSDARTPTAHAHAVADVTGLGAVLAQKADATDLPYRLVTPGEWEFSGLSGDETGAAMAFSDGEWWLFLAFEGGESDSAGPVAGSENDLAVVFADRNITATRPSLPGRLCDRAANAVSVSSATTFTLPALVTGRSRDLLVRLIVSADAAVTFSAPTGETVTWDDAGSPTATYEAGTHLLRFTEVAQGVFHFDDLGSGGSIDPSVLAAKLDSTSAAPAFDSTKTYSVGEYATYEGALYECTAAVTVAGAWTGSTNWTATDMTSPDATLDLMADGRLRLVSADGDVLWTQGYGLAPASSATLSCDKVNYYAFASGTTSVAFSMPTAPSGKVGDFVLDVDNTANASAGATATLTGAGTAFDVFTPEGVNLSTDVLTFAGGERCELYFTMTAFGTAAKPAWKVVKQIVEKQEFGS